MCYRDPLVTQGLTWVTHVHRLALSWFLGLNRSSDNVAKGPMYT